LFLIFPVEQSNRNIGIFLKFCVNLWRKYHRSHIDFSTNEHLSKHQNRTCFSSKFELKDLFKPRYFQNQNLNPIQHFYMIKMESYKLILKAISRYNFQIFQYFVSIRVFSYLKVKWLNVGAKPSIKIKFQRNFRANTQRYPRSRDQLPCLDCSDWQWIRVSKLLDY
jgi:hypothetical protein